MINNTNDMMATIYEWSVEFKCPCGDSMSGEGMVIQNFINNHAKHTSGYIAEYIPSENSSSRRRIK